MLKPVITALILTRALSLAAQNLIANGSLEDLNLCTEYEQYCAPEAWFRFPARSIPRPQNLPQPADGKSFDMLVYEDFIRPVTHRTYFYTRLLCPLESASSYKLSFYVNPARQRKFKMGVYFSATAPDRQTNDPRRQTASLVLNETMITESKSYGWVKVETTFRANGNEAYLIFGNFDPKPLEVPAKKKKDRIRLFYLIDNVSLQPINPETRPCPDLFRNLDTLYALNDRHSRRKTYELPDEPEAEEEDPPTRNDDPFHELDSVEPDIAVEATPDTVAVVVQAVPEEIKFVIPDIGFEFDRYDLKPAADSLLNLCFRQIEKLNPKTIRINGFTDDVGSESYNLELSGKRAASVRDWFVRKKNLPAAIFAASGYGESNPVATNDTDAGRQANRRVEIELIR